MSSSYSSLRGALQWSAAEEASSRISAVKRSYDDVNKQAAAAAQTTAMKQQLRQGLSELDAVREFLHDGINKCNQKYMDGGSKDRMLYDALERGLGELEDVRRKLVTSLNQKEPTTAVPLPRSNSMKQPLKGNRRKSEAKPPFSSANVNTTSTNLESKLNASPFSATGQRLHSRPTSATTRKPPTGNQQPSSTKQERPGKEEESASAVPKPSRIRPQSAPSRRQNAPPPSRSEPNPPAPGLSSSTNNNGSGAKWAQYQDWAQNVMKSAQSRRVWKHQQFLAAERQEASAPSTGPSNDSAPAQEPPKPRPQRPMSATTSAPSNPTGASSVAGFSSLRKHMHARPSSATVRAPSQDTSIRTSATPQKSIPVPGKLSSEAQSFREQGNVFFQQKRYNDAATSYTKAINLEPLSETLFCNRAAAYLMMSRFNEALRDSQQAIELDPMHVKAHWRAAKASLYLGNNEQARALYSRAQKLCENAADAESITAELKAVDHVERCRRCLRLREWHDAMKCADQLLEVFPASGPCSTPWQCLKVEAQVNIDAAEALAAVTKMNQEDALCGEAWFLRAKSVFYTGHDAVSTSAALGFINRCREVDPKHGRASVLYACIDTFAKLRDEGNGAYAAGRWQESYVAYTKCLSVDPYNTSLKAIILCNRAAVCIQCERWKDALEDINQSISLNPNNAKTYTRRARIHQQQGNIEAAIKDLQLAVQMYPSAENQERLNQAIDTRNQKQRQQQAQQQQQQQQSSSHFGSGSRFFGGTYGSRPSSAGPKRPNQTGGSTNTRQRPQSATVHHHAPPQRTLYDTLGVPRTADERTIVKAYRDGALKWHPDKWATGTPSEKLHAETMFKDIANAYNTLRDVTKRRQYDLTIMVA